MARSFSERVKKTRSSIPLHGAPGKNVRMQADWRERLLDALPKDPLSYRRLAEVSIAADGTSLAHTTVRSVLLGNGTIAIDTLAAICDGLGIDMVQIISGKSSCRALAPPNVRLPPRLNITALPIVDIGDAPRWVELANNPEHQSGVYFTETENAKDLMVARITDDSMAPDYMPGDLVTFRKGEPPNPKVPAIVRIEDQGGAALRMLRSSGERVKLQALNEDYGSQVVSPKRIDFMGHVVSHVRETALTNQ